MPWLDYFFAELRHNISMKTAIELQQISVELGGSRILNNLSLRVFSGRVHALLGRNGAGKSTAFKALLGLVPVQTGAVSVFGRPVTSESLKYIGSSINGPALYDHLSARDNVKIHALLLGLPKTEIDRVLTLVGLAQAGKKKAKSFSTGMRARLALAIAMLGSPPILILDEPQNGLDPQGITDLRQFLQQWARAGGTVLVSSHQLGEVSRLADDITVIDSGTTVFSGTAEQFLQGEDLESRFLSITGQNEGLQ
ncbi:Daunorubicin/doxorubicin resistance ATP-binding protein DrrA [Corynebacterium freiburgense]|nr:Daunorubicin/doxorubicin resistance ATP-binding protein DrrA [Corynebacterium freiburgense]